MPVTLSYAMQGGHYIHITDKIQKDVPLFCPHCNDAVIAKKGAKMQHHFSHKPYARCSASAESLLHFESKMYLKSLILHKTPVDFTVKIAYLDEKIRRWYELLGTKEAVISLPCLIESYGIQNATEETGILGYIPDVLGIGKHSFAFEVFVTHAIEEKKMEAFKRAGVEYIELIPTREEDGTFTYAVYTAHLPRYYAEWAQAMDTQFEQTIRPQLYEEFKENETKIAEKIKEEMKPIIAKEVCQTLADNIERFYVTHGEKLTRKQAITHEVRCEPPYKAGETLRLHASSARTGKNGLPYLLLKDGYKRSFTVDGTIPLFAALLDELNRHYEIHMTTNEKGNVDGLVFTNTLDKMGFDEEVKQLLKRNLAIMQKQMDEKK